MRGTIKSIIILCCALSASSNNITRNVIKIQETKAPYIVGVMLNDTYTCAGVIVNSTAVLTSDACILSGYTKAISPEFYVQGISVKVGTDKLSQRGITYKVYSLKLPYANNEVGIYASSITIVNLLSELRFYKSVKAIGLPSKDVERNTVSTAYGWSYASENNNVDRNDSLSSIKLRIVSHEECRNVYNGISDNNFCAVSSNNDGLCFGNSGSILVQDDILIGVSLYGLQRNCSTRKQYYVYVNVYKHLGFVTNRIIQDRIQNAPTTPTTPYIDPELIWTD